MVGAGTFLNPLLKIVTVVAVLAASYFFIVKPILDTTNDTIDRAFDESANIQKSVQQSIKQANQQANQQGAGNVQFSASGLSPKQAEKIQNCVQKASGDVNALQACGELANRLSSK
jgi:predicted PurR-regulated permease PerM